MTNRNKFSNTCSVSGTQYDMRLKPVFVTAFSFPRGANVVDDGRALFTTIGMQKLYALKTCK